MSRKKGEATGSKNSNWKGGKIINSGYLHILKPNHPRVSASKYYKYVANGVLVAEKILERYLDKKEIVHHINSVRNDDRPENLYLFATKGEHISYHNTKGIKKELASNIISNTK